MASKASLNICLIEPVIFVARPRRVRGEETLSTQSAILRGLLVLKLPKPSKITSVEVFLEGRSKTEWPEGIGPRRVEVTEEHELLNAHTVFFRAGSAPHEHRRATSLGPGVLLDYGEDSDHEDGHRAHDRPVGLDDPMPTRPTRGRRLSEDNLQRSVVSHEAPTIPPNVPSPPYSADPTYTTFGLPPCPMPLPSPSPNTYELRSRRDAIADDSPDHTSVEVAPTRENSATGDAFPRVAMLSATSSSSSVPRPPLETRSSSISGESPEEEQDAPVLSALPPRTRSPSSLRNTPLRDTPPRPPRDSSAGPSAPQTQQIRDQSRGRAHARFSLSAVSNVLKEVSQEVKNAVRSSSGSRPPAQRALRGSASVGPLREEREESPFPKPSEERGRRAAPVKLANGTNGVQEETEDNADDGEGWKEFKKGTYTYPISFSIPTDTPPSLSCDFGSVSYRLKAYVHRLGTFTSKLTASVPVNVVASPNEEDTEETDSIFVERQWDSQLHYLVMLSGRSFPIGGHMPFSITLMPLDKMALFRITVFLEEQVDYYAHGKRVVRHDPLKRFLLLSIKHPDKFTQILPILSNSANAFAESPLYPMVESPEDSDAVAQILNPTGPWSLHRTLQVPDCFHGIHFTNKHAKSHINIQHNMKIVLRVQRGDNEQMDAKGRKKQFDIIIETPVHILSCRCNPEFMHLPTYSSLTEGSEIQDASPCICRRPNPNQKAPSLAGMGPRSPHRARDPNGANMPSMTSAGAGTGPIHVMEAPLDDTTSPTRRAQLIENNSQFARLVAGMESELGEAPPAYHSTPSVPGSAVA